MHQHQILIILKNGVQVRTTCTRFKVTTSNGHCTGWEADDMSPVLLHLDPTEIVAVIKES